MISYDRALRTVGREISSLKTREGSLPPTPYVALEISSTLDSLRWENYDEDLPHLKNIRSLIDRILKEDGIEYLREPKTILSTDFDEYFIDWGFPKEARLGLGVIHPIARSERLRRQLCR